MALNYRSWIVDHVTNLSTGFKVCKQSIMPPPPAIYYDQSSSSRSTALDSRSWMNRPLHQPPKNGGIALWPNTRVVNCKALFHKRQTSTICRPPRQGVDSFNGLQAGNSLPHAINSHQYSSWWCVALDYRSWRYRWPHQLIDRIKGSCLGLQRGGCVEIPPLLQ